MSADTTVAGADVLRRELQGRQVGFTVSIDDVRVVLAQAGVTGNALGGLFRHAVSAGWLVYLGSRPSVHAAARGRRVGRYVIAARIPDRVVVPRYPHPACGHNPGPLGRTCQACDMVAAYHSRRQQYLDAVEESDRQNEVQTPVLPKVTFRWWLRLYEWATDQQQRIAA